MGYRAWGGVSSRSLQLLHLDQAWTLMLGQDSYVSKDGPLGGLGGLAVSQTSCWTQRMEKDTEYGVPWLRKRVPVGTWVKKCKWLIEGVLWVYFSGKLVNYNIWSLETIGVRNNFYIALDSDSDIIVVDHYNHLIRKLNGITSTLSSTNDNHTYQKIFRGPSAFYKDLLPSCW